MSSSTKFSLLTTDHLASDPNAEVTLQNLIETSDRMAEEAREVLPYSFDECTYPKGYLRQNVWSCIDCGEKGVCYGCSISCHSEHRLVELWTKRNFRCDCPTTSMSGPESAGPSKRRKCTLTPPERQPQEPNEGNVYSKNFGGKFCRCGRDYDPETEEEAMVTCIGCEDWYHESCLNLRPPRPPSASLVTEQETEDDDDERDILIRSESYDGLVCADCVARSELSRRKAGSEGWMMIVRRERKGSWRVIGRDGAAESSAQVGDKRSLEMEEDGPEAKRLKGEDGGLPAEANWKRGGQGDVFLAEGIRSKLKSELSTDEIASLPFPLEDAEIYEPPKDTDEDETLDEVTSRVMQGLPRVQAIEALHGYQRMKEKLSAMIATRAESGAVISKEDIETFFSELRGSKAH